jgi:hypothetical protein
LPHEGELIERLIRSRTAEAVSDAFQTHVWTSCRRSAFADTPCIAISLAGERVCMLIRKWKE